MKRLDTNHRSFTEQFKKILCAENMANTVIQQQVSHIIEQIKQQGDKALLELTQRLDKNNITDATALKIDTQKASHYVDKISPEIIKDLQLAIDRITVFHKKQLIDDWHYVDDSGVLLGQKTLAVEKAGVYVPGGKACYPSSILMNVIPAQVAGVKHISLVTPAMNGYLNPIILVTAHLLGIDNIFQIGGAQAIAALAYGTETITAVDKITGPGNAYVAEAKRQVFGTVGIDMIAGPSEVVIIADEQANPKHLVYDLFAQAEHDELARAILISRHQHILDETARLIAQEIKKMPRQSIIEQSLQHHGALIKTNSLQESVELSNQIAPEHLELCVQDPQEVMQKITSAGAIFLGYDTPEAFGDYLAGSNHILPTSRSARFSSPLGVYDFQKRSNYIQASKESCAELYPAVMRLAKSEELTAHAASCELRLNNNE